MLHEHEEVEPRSEAEPPRRRTRVWRRVLPELDDAGGVAFDPGQPGRLIAQEFNSDWTVDGDVLVSPTWRAANNAARQAEENASRFYSNVAVRRRPDGVTQVVIGTNRVWFSTRWGASRWDGVAGVWRGRPPKSLTSRRFPSRAVSWANWAGTKRG